ncbi:MAG: hypothetical protein QOD26_2241 [Betaproteobacteria bacterium]|jgi:hypothetical protein|nr:hypothetical protein [Betaproteobacteria bacterium]
MNLLLLVALAQAPASPPMVISKVELQACGVYESTPQVREDDARSVTGKRTIVQDERLMNETSRIPARVGVKFGCQVILQGAPAGEVAEFRAVMRVPRGEASGSQAFRIGDPGYVGYTLRTAERGPWILEIWVGENKLAEKTFVAE